MNFLEQRFHERRLDALPEFESLPGAASAVPYLGTLTLWQVLRTDDGRVRLAFLDEYAPEFKVQFAAFHEDRLLVYGSDRLEVFDASFQKLATIRDPWMVGGHTVHVDDENTAWVTSAPANAALRVSLETYEVIERLSMPESYGKGYPLDATTDLHEHLIPTDYQPTHLNSAVPSPYGLIVTLFSHGAVGVFDHDRRYREIASGFIGCHGGRHDPETGQIYLTDSAAGVLWFLDPETGRTEHRTRLTSEWLHDACHLGDGLFAVTVSDRNHIVIIDRNGQTLCEVDGSPYGASTQFVSCFQVSEAWADRFREKPSDSSPVDLSVADDEGELGDDRSPPFSKWTTVPGFELEVSSKVATAQAMRYQYLATSDLIPVPMGTYLIEAEIEVDQGGVTVGVLDEENEAWLTTLAFDAVNATSADVFEVVEDQSVRLILAANNAHRDGPIVATVRAIRLRKFES